MNRANGQQDFIPPGWSYNPSSWGQRLPIVAVAFAGFFIAGYLALYQWRVFAHVWEPLFGDGSIRVLHSRLSRVLPIPDAALGAIGYIADALSGIIGGRDRWFTMPWIVLVFSLAVGPLGAVSVFLVIMQPVLLHGWCTLCLCSAVLSILMISPAMDETLASLQFLKQQHQQGKSLWHAFWGIHAGSIRVEATENRTKKHA
jgi:hypothetical protein